MTRHTMADHPAQAPEIFCTMLMLSNRGKESVAVMSVLTTYLSHSAALLMSIFVEGEHALLPHEVHCFLSVWKGVLYADAIVLLHCVEEAVRLGVQPACIKAAPTYTWSAPAHHQSHA